MWRKNLLIALLLMAALCLSITACNTDSGVSFNPDDSDSEIATDGDSDITPDNLETVQLKGSSTSGGNAISVFMVFTSYNAPTLVDWSSLSIRLDSAYLPDAPACDSTNGAYLSADGGAVTLRLLAHPTTELELLVPTEQDYCSIDFNLPEQPVAFQAEGETTDGSHIAIQTDLSGLLPFTPKSGNFRFEADKTYRWLAALDLGAILSEDFLASLAKQDNGDILIDAEHNADKLGELNDAILKAFALWIDGNENNRLDDDEQADDNCIAVSGNLPDTDGDTDGDVDGDVDGDNDTPPECEECVGFAGSYCMEGPAPTGQCDISGIENATIHIEVDPEVECGYIIWAESDDLIVTDPQRFNITGCDLDNFVYPQILPICTTEWNREEEQFEYSCTDCDLVFSKAACEDVPPLCPDAIPLRCGDHVEHDTTIDGREDQWRGYSCSARLMSGREVVYEFMPPTDALYTYFFQLTNLTTDLDLFLLDGCDSMTCTYFSGTPLDIQHGEELLSAPDTGSGESLYLVVDGYDGAAGSYTLDVNCVDHLDGDVDGDNDQTLDECLYNCGDGCFTIDQMVCAEDGRWQCPCEMACYGIEEAADDSFCDGDCTFQPDGAPCNDGNPQTEDDRCQTGLCVGDLPLDICIEGEPHLKIYPENMDFGAVQVGTRKLLPLTLCNICDNNNLSIQDISFTSDSSGYFAIYTADATALPINLLPASCVQPNIAFNPLGVGDISAVIEIASNDTTHYVPDVAISGRGVSSACLENTPRISVSPTEIDLGVISIGQIRAVEIDIHNVCNAALTVQDIQLTSESQQDQFSIDVPATPFVIMPAASMAIPLNFIPTTSGNWSARINIYSNDPDSPITEVVVHGIAQ